MPAQWTAEIIGKMHLNGVTAKQLATAVGWNPKYLSQVLNGHKSPKTAENKEAAELYINFMLEEEIAVANANYICYATPHSNVLESDDYELKGDPVLYPDEKNTPKTEMFENLDYETQNYMNMLWNELKIEGNSNLDAYIGLSVTAALIVVYAVYKFIKKKKREAMY